MKKFIIEAKWAIIFSIALILWMYFEKSMSWHDEKIKHQHFAQRYHDEV